MFDYDNDNKIKYEEFEYFMSNFGESENSYMDNARIQLLMECCKPLDQHGNIIITTLVDNINSCWHKVKKWMSVKPWLLKLSLRTEKKWLRVNVDN